MDYAVPASHHALLQYLRNDLKAIHPTDLYNTGSRIRDEKMWSTKKAI